jgi:topoisomerase IA-like protein
MKQTNPIEEYQKLKTDKDYLQVKLNEAKEIIKDKDKIIVELKKNLDNMKTRTLLLL